MQRHPSRRLVLASSLAAAAPAWAQAPKPAAKAAAPTPPWPSKPVRILVGFPPGSSPDLSARLLTEPLSRALGQPVIVDNKPGASGNIAAEMLAKATDDHTIGLLSVVNLTTARMLNPKLGYEPADFTPLTIVGTSPLILVGAAQVAAGSAADFLLAARNGSDKWNYGSPGAGTVGHLGMELIKLKSSLRPLHVPFQGVPQIINAMIGGQVQMALIPVGQAMTHVRAGRIKAIGSTAGARSPLAPEVPTLREIGVTGVDLEVWNALAAPKGLPAPFAQRVLREAQDIIRSAEVRQQLFQQGWQAMGTSPEALKYTMKQTAAALGGVIQMGNIRLE